MYRNIEFFLNKNNFFFNKKSNFSVSNKFFFLKKTKKQNIIDLFFSDKLYFILISQNFKNFFIQNNFFLKCFSNSKIFKNLEWYEREMHEMSKKKINNIYDSRTLLLMYSFFLNKHERYYKEDKGQHPYFSFKKKNIIFKKRNYIIL